MRHLRYAPLGLLALAALAAAVVAVAGPAYGGEPLFTRNGVPGVSVSPGNSDVLSLDVTLPAPDQDVFLDGDGVATTGPGFPDAVAAGTPFTPNFPNIICGNTDGATAPTKLRFDTSADCSSIDGFNILGADTSGTVFDMAAAVSRVHFVDGDSDGAWANGEDFYFDADDSGLYNADTLDALTVRNVGTAAAGADIAAVKLWHDSDGSGSFSGTDALLAVCPFNGLLDWECDVNFTFTVQPRVFVTVDIATGATVGRTIQLQIPALSDFGIPGAFDPLDSGVFFVGDHDGPPVALTNEEAHTIACPDSDGDGWTDCQEAYIGTDPLNPCTPGGWPPDPRPLPGGNAIVQIDDVTFVASAFGSTTTPRAEIKSQNGIVQIDDVTDFAGRFGDTC